MSNRMRRQSAILWITILSARCLWTTGATTRSRQQGNPALPWSEMDEPSGSESTGMGPSPSGPSFVPWAPAPDDLPPIGPPSPDRSARSMARQPSRLPTVISMAVIFLVVVVVAAASVVAHFADTQVRAPGQQQATARRSLLKAIGLSSLPAKEVAS